MFTFAVEIVANPIQLVSKHWMIGVVWIMGSFLLSWVDATYFDSCT